MTLNAYVVNAYQVSSGDNERDAFFLLKTELDLSLFHEKTQKVIALMALLNEYPIHSTKFVINGESSSWHTLKDLIGTDDPEIYCEQYLEYAYIKNLNPVSKEGITFIEKNIPIKSIALSEKQLGEIQSFEENILSNADCIGFELGFFSYDRQEAHNIEYLGEDKDANDRFYIDVNAFFAYTKKFGMGAKEYMLVCARNCFLTVLCSPEKVMSFESDEQFHCDFDYKYWMVLERCTEEKRQNSDANVFETNGELWCEYPVLNTHCTHPRLAELESAFVRLNDKNTIHRLLNNQNMLAIYNRLQHIIQAEYAEIRKQKAS